MGSHLGSQSLLLELHMKCLRVISLVAVLIGMLLSLHHPMRASTSSTIFVPILLQSARPFLAFTGAPAFSDSNIFVADPTGAQPRQLTSSVADELEPTWSPDGTHIAFATRQRT